MPRQARRDPGVAENQIGVSLPAPLTGRLDGLLLVAEDAGERTSRRELVSALIWSAPSHAEGLLGSLRGYRQATNAAVRIPGQPAALYLQPIRTPGPRRLWALRLPEEAGWAEVEGVRVDRMPRVRIGLTVSIALEQKLNSMLDALTDQLERTTRNEIIAALILSAPSNADALTEVLRGYRRAIAAARQTKPERRTASRSSAAQRAGPVAPGPTHPTRRKAKRAPPR